MARKVVPFRSWHYADLGPAAEGVENTPLPDDILAATEEAYSWSFVADDAVVCCMGAMTPWPGRHCVWAYMGQRCRGGVMLWVTREARRLAAALRGRLEMTVRADFEAGHRWAKLLGFGVETPLLRGYGPAGEDHVGYVRMN